MDNSLIVNARLHAVALDAVENQVPHPTFHSNQPLLVALANHRYLQIRDSPPFRLTEEHHGGQAYSVCYDTLHSLSMGPWLNEVNSIAIVSTDKVRCHHADLSLSRTAETNQLFLPN